MGDFTMPSLGADMDAGSVLEWCVAPGDAVHRGDVVAVIHTDKNDIDAEAFEDGVIGALLVEPGVEVAVGTPIATIVPAGSSSAPPGSPSASPEPEGEPQPEPEPEPEGRSRSRPRPPAPVPRRTSRPCSRPSCADWCATATSIPTASSARARAGRSPGPTSKRPPRPPPRAPQPAGPPRLPPLDPPAHPAASRPGPAASPPSWASIRTWWSPDAAARSLAMRRRIATLIERSKREIPHYHLLRRIDLTTALAWLTRHNEDRPARERMIPAALLLAAVARAAAEVPGFNGHWRDGAYQPADRVDLGLIVTLRDGGLLVPVIADAAALGAPEMMERVHGAVSRARKGRLRSSELGEGTITVSELGDAIHGACIGGGIDLVTACDVRLCSADAVFGVIHPPQVALVGFGRPHEVPWAQDGMVGVRTVVDTTLAADHRVSDGHAGSRFLLALDTALQDPAALEGAPS